MLSRQVEPGRKADSTAWVAARIAAGVNAHSSHHNGCCCAPRPQHSAALAASAAAATTARSRQAASARAQSAGPPSGAHVQISSPNGDACTFPATHSPPSVVENSCACFAAWRSCCCTSRCCANWSSSACAAGLVGRRRRWRRLCGASAGRPSGCDLRRRDPTGHPRTLPTARTCTGRRCRRRCRVCTGSAPVVVVDPSHRRTNIPSRRRTRSLLLRCRWCCDGSRRTARRRC
jgi:hypothetical protein